MGMNNRLMRPRASGGFKPTQIAGLEMWFDAADASSITLNSGNVSQWSDKSGNSRHGTQETAANQPAYSSSQQNGRGGINFQNSKWLTTSGAEFTIAQPVTIFTVLRSPASPAQWSAFDGTSSRVHLYGNNNDQAYMYSGSNGDLLSFSPDATTVAILIYDGAGSKYALNSRTLINSTSSPGTSSLSTQMRIGANNGAASQLKNYMFELGLYSKSLSATEASAIAKYLASKWAVAIS